MGDRKLRRSNSIGRSLLKLQGFDVAQDYDKGALAKEENRFLFEIAWEVANKGTSARCRPLRKLSVVSCLWVFQETVFYFYSWRYLYSHSIKGSSDGGWNGGAVHASRTLQWAVCQNGSWNNGAWQQASENNHRKHAKSRNRSKFFTTFFMLLIINISTTPSHTPWGLSKPVL